MTLRTLRRPGRDSGRSLRRSLQGELRASWRLLAAVLTLFVVTATATFVWTEASLDPRMEQSITTVRQLRCVHAAMLEQESGLRAFVSTGSSRFLRTVDAASWDLAACRTRLVQSSDSDHELSTRISATLIAAQRWQEQWADPARTELPRSTGTLLTTTFLHDDTLFRDYRTAEEAAVNLATRRRDEIVQWQQNAVRGTGAIDGAVALALLVVELRRRRRLHRVLGQPVRDVLSTVDRVLAGELAVQPPDLEVAELGKIGTGVASLARRLEHEQAGRLLHEEIAARLGSRLQVVLGVARATAGSPSPYAVARTVAAAAVELGRVSAVVWLMPDDGAPLVPVSADEVLSPDAFAPSTAVKRAARTAEPVRMGTRACFPLVGGGRVVGVLDVVDDAWDDEDAAQVDSVLEALAGFAAVALAAAELHAQTLEQARSDALTGLRNRRSLDTDLPVEFQRAFRYDRPMSVALLDVDHFKRVNDTAGHAIGDAWLQIVGRIARDQLRGSDTAYRYGGEELVLVLPEADEDAAAIVAERLREAVAAAAGPTAYPHVSISIGIATASVAMHNAGELLAAADAALYAAKRGGRDQVVRHSSLANRLIVT